MSRRATAGGGSRRSGRSADPGDTVPAIMSNSTAMLCVGLAVSKVLGAFLAHAALVRYHLPEPLFLGVALVAASAVLLVLQQPWRAKESRSLTPTRMRRVALGGLLQAVTLGAWMAGLRSSGPLRSFLVEGAEVPLLYLFAVATSRDLPSKKKTRGALLMLLGYLLLMYDASGRMAKHVERFRHTRLGHKADELTNATKHHIVHGLHELDQLRQAHHAVPQYDKATFQNTTARVASVAAAAAAAAASNKQAKQPPPLDDDGIPGGGPRRRLLQVENQAQEPQEDTNHGGEGENPHHEYDEEDYSDYDYDDYDYEDYDYDDEDGHAHTEGDTGHQENEHTSQHEHIIEASSTSATPPKRHVLHTVFVSRALRAEIGVFLLLATSVVHQSTRGFTRRVATEVGGAKRYFAMSTVFATIFTLPFSLISYILVPKHSRAYLHGGWAMYLSLFAGIAFVVIPFYLRGIVSGQMRQTALLKMSLVIPSVVCLVGSFIPYFRGLSGHGTGLLVVTVLLCETIGLTMMASGRLPSELPLTDPRGK